MVSFTQDIKPLFPEYDRNQMRFAFDLWNYEEVKGAAAAILERLETGDMPCDKPWPKEQVALFRSWIDAGLQP